MTTKAHRLMTDADLHPPFRFFQSSDPGVSAVEGDAWVDTTGGTPPYPIKRRNGSAGWDLVGNTAAGTITDVAIASANGLAGTSDHGVPVPTVTLSCSVTGVLKSDGTTISAAVAGTDYVVPSGNITGTASNVSGIVAVAHGGSGADLSGSGGGHYFVFQEMMGGDFTSRVITTADLGTGTANSTTYLRGDLTWQTAQDDTLVFNETPSGVIDGANAAFTLANSPVAGTLLLFKNNLYQIEGAGAAYTLSGNTITFMTAPSPGDAIIAALYRK